MNAERAREFLLTLPHVVEGTQWGDLIYWLGPQALGGKMFAMVNADRGHELIISFPAGPERFAELVEVEGIIPAPYFARIHWVSVERWDVLRDREWQDELTAAHSLTYTKLPPKVKKTLSLPKAEQKRLLAERKKVLAARAATKAARE